jgi:hypothetical protein
MKRTISVAVAITGCIAGLLVTVRLLGVSAEEMSALAALISAVVAVRFAVDRSTR